MTVKLTGKEWNEFMADEAWWPDGRYFEDEILMYENGEVLEDYDGIPDTNKLKLDGGEVKDEPSVNPIITVDYIGTVESYFRQWCKVQTRTWLVVEVDKGQRNKVVEAVKAIGGKIVK